jgi:hypothetical protein
MLKLRWKFERVSLLSRFIAKIAGFYYQSRCGARAIANFLHIYILKVSHDRKTGLDFLLD